MSVDIPFILTIIIMSYTRIAAMIRPLLIKSNMYAKIEEWLEMKNKSRKLFLLYVVLILATLGTFAPPIIVWILGVFGKNVPSFSILGSTEWVSMVSLILTTYFGSNVWEKKVALSNGIYPNQIDDTVMQIKGSPGAQQVNVQVDVNNQMPDAEMEELRDALRHGR